MINIVNEAINRKLNSMSFTNIITGKVESLEPLQIRINNRIVIGQSFIEPMSLGLSDYSPNSALPLFVGETVQMVRYNNGQRFYILGKSTSEGVTDYTQLTNLPRLVTTNSTPQDCCAEDICHTINLHRIAKTGKYSDLLDKPQMNKVFTIQNNLNNIVYNKIAELTDDIGNSYNNIMLEISGNSNFGDARLGIDILQAGCRGGGTLRVNGLMEGYHSPCEYGYIKNAETGLMEVWMKRTNYTSTMTIRVLDERKAATGICVVGNLKEQTIEPSGITYITRKVLTNKNYVDTNFLQFEIVEEF